MTEPAENSDDLTDQPEVEEPDFREVVHPETLVIQVGTVFWRIHKREYDPVEFYNPVQQNLQPGGRFDSYDGEFGHIYGGSDTNAAVAETLLRDTKRRVGFLRKVQLKGKNLSKLKAQRDLEVVKLHGNGLKIIGQDSRLTSCGPRFYSVTQKWAKHIRSCAKNAIGFRWRPRNDNDRFAYIFFGDRAPEDSFSCVASHPIDQPGRGCDLVCRAAAKYRVFLP